MMSPGNFHEVVVEVVFACCRNIMMCSAAYTSQLQHLGIPFATMTGEREADIHTRSTIFFGEGEKYITGRRNDTEQRLA